MKYLSFSADQFLTGKGDDIYGKIFKEEYFTFDGLENLVTPYANDGTVNTLYTDTRYNEKLRYNDNLNATRPSLKR